MRKVLIVSPRFPPTNAPDAARIRVSLGFYRRFGWDPTVLCVDPATSEGIDDPLLAQSLPADVKICRVAAWREKTCRWFGFGQLAYRSLLPLYRAGTRLLAHEPHDVIFFSTTAFLTFALGPLWKRRFKARVVYDFQDPWYDDQSIYTPATVPGRWWKYRLDQWLAAWLEKRVVASADHIFSVSPEYAQSLRARYDGHLENGPEKRVPVFGARSCSNSKREWRFTVLPFGAALGDFEFARHHDIGQSIFRPGDGSVHWVYAGRGGADMEAIIGALFRSLAELRTEDPAFAARLRVHFVGTNYAARDKARKLVEPLAQRHGVAELVEETPARVPYFEALSLYRASDAVLIIGSVRGDYYASKLFPCVLSGRPVLALVRSESPLCRMAATFANVFCATFERDPLEPAFLQQVRRGLAWLRAPIFDPASIERQLAPWSAENLTRIQCQIFDRLASPPECVVEPHPLPGGSRDDGRAETVPRTLGTP
jgi:hypothetical protein